VRDAFLYTFGRNALWWLTLILILACVVVFELGVESLRATFWTQDVDVFRSLEKDAIVRSRFEEAAKGELPYSLPYTSVNGAGGSKEEELVDTQAEGLEKTRTPDEERRREGEVAEMLAHRPGLADVGRSTDVEEALRGAFGRVREE
jgi:phospholipid-translocating ATPase